MAPCVAAILLAAGQSRRMGTCKQLLPLEGRTVIARSLETLLAGGVGELIVVIGPDGDEVARAARDYPVTIVRTSDPRGDMATSVRTGRDLLSLRRPPRSSRSAITRSSRRQPSPASSRPTT